MKTRQLGNTDLHLTEVGFGAWAVGGPWKYGWGEQDDKESIATIRRALDLGVNWIDTAHVYGFGRSERVVGEAIKGRRDGVIVATKCGLLNDGANGAKGVLKRESVREEIDGSLKRLGIDRIDLYQIHWPDPEPDIEEAWEEIQRAIAAGKIRHAGVSNFNVPQMQRVAAIAPIASLQPPYSMLRRGIEEAIIPHCGANRIGIVAYSPMVSGLLTGKVTKAWVDALAADDWRKAFNSEFKSPNLEANIALVEETLRPIGDAHGVSPACVAIAWVLRDARVTSAIVGARRPDQVDGVVKAAGLVLSDDELERIEAALKRRQAALAKP